MSAGHRRRSAPWRAARAGIATLAALLVLEAAARAVAPALPELNNWREPLIQVKVDQMTALGHHGGADVVLAGSSQMLFAGDPLMWQRQFGANFSVYNAGMWGASPVVTEHWLLHVVVPRLRPKSVVLGLSDVDFVPADRTFADGEYFNAPAVRNDTIGRLERFAADHSDLVAYRRDLRVPRTVVDSIGRRLDGIAGPPVRVASLDRAGRLAQVDALTFVDNTYTREVADAIVKYGGAVDPVEQRAFEDTVRSLRAQGIEVVLVQMPVSSALIHRYRTPADYAAFHTFLAHEGSALGVPVIDGTKGITDTHLFADYDHVNRAGANAFNALLAAALRPGRPGTFMVALNGSAAMHASPTLAARPVSTPAAKPAVAKASPPTAGRPAAAASPASTPGPSTPTPKAAAPPLVLDPLP